MNKKIAHTILIIGDFLCLTGLWYGYHIFSRILEEISNKVEIIKYGNRIGFFIVCIGFPLIHFLILLERYQPDIIKKHIKLANQGVIAMVIILIITGFAGSIWINTKIENAGYVYCSKASGVGATSKSLVYTKDMEICEALVASKKAQLHR